MYPNGESDVHPDAIKLANKLKEERIPSTYFAEREDILDLIIYGCESPIEQMLAIALAYIKPDFMHIGNQVEVRWYKDLSDKQKERIFRPDFVIGFNWTELTPGWEYASRGDWWDSAEAYK